MTLYRKGLHEIGDRTFAWLQPDGGWGWSNAGLITDGDDAFLVDTLFDLRLTAEMLDAMRRAVPAAANITTVLNTHANGDHCYGNQLVTGAEILASRRAAEEMRRVPASVLAALMDGAPGMGEAGAFLQRIFGPFEFHGITDVLPTRTFDGRLTVEVGATEVVLIELGPAHTAGDVVALVPSRRTLFAGDLLFIGGHPIVWAGPVQAWIDALDAILAMDVDVIVPGHGPVTDKAGVSELRAYFVELTAQARPLWEEGLTPLAAARRVTIDRAAGWGEHERLAVNVAACFRQFSGDNGGDAVLDVFGDMAALSREGR
jgi:cyclase